MATIKKNKHAEPGTGQVRTFDNYKFAIGTGMNYVDMDTGILYHIRDYVDAIRDKKIPLNKKPTTIKMTDYKTGEVKGYIEASLLQEKMKDPEPDPRY